MSAQKQKGDNHEGSHHSPQLVLVWLHSLLSAVIFQWQCAGCQFLEELWAGWLWVSRPHHKGGDQSPGLKVEEQTWATTSRGFCPLCFGVVKLHVTSFPSKESPL